MCMTQKCVSWDSPPPSPTPPLTPRLCWGTGASGLQEPLLVTAGRQVQPSGLGLPEAWPQGPYYSANTCPAAPGKGGQAGRACSWRGRATLGPTPDPGRCGVALGTGTGVLGPHAGAAPVQERFLLRSWVLYPGIPGF